MRAIDQAGNVSTTDLSVTQRTADEGMPSWPDGTLMADPITPSSSSQLARSRQRGDRGLCGQPGWSEIARTDGER